MNIAILGLTATSYGSLTYLKNFLPQLARIDQSNQYDVFLHAANLRELEVQQPNFRIHCPSGAPKSGTLRVLWEQVMFPWLVRRQRPDAIYTTQNLAILLSPTPSIIVVQNVEPFFSGQFPNRVHLRARLWLLRKLAEASLRRSHRIVAISDWERDFLVDHFNVPPNKIIVSYPGVTAGFHPPNAGSAILLRERFGIEPPYILSATRLAGYGNLLGVVRAYICLIKSGKISMPLVVPGGIWDSDYVGQVTKLLAAEGCSDYVKFLGYVPHELMPLLFGHATCFVFPSLLEACGTVLIEALACGTPILCCRRRPMTDICGDAAIYFQAEDPDHIAAKTLEVLSNPSLRQELSRRAVARSAEFSWQQGAEKVYQLFEQIGHTSSISNRRTAAASSAGRS